MTKEVFERMLVEFQDLNERTTACRDFILDEAKFGELDMINRDLLIAQLKAMETYLSILSIRLGINGMANAEATPEQVVEDSEDIPEIEPEVVEPGE